MDKKKKILIIIILILFILVIFLAYLVFSKFVLKSNFEKSILPFANKNDETIFYINQIVFLVIVMQKIKIYQQQIIH